MNITPRAVVGALLLTALPALSLQFEEQNHIVSMEAEHATENVGWVEKSGLDGASGVTLEDNGVRGEGHISFEIYFHTTGTFFVWALHAKPTDATDNSNDCFGDFNGNHFEIWGGSSCTGHTAEVIGLGTHQKSLGWQSRPKTECSADRSKHVYITVTQTGWNTFTLTSRSKGYLMDKLMLIHESIYGTDVFPTGTGAPETVYDGAATGVFASGIEERMTLRAVDAAVPSQRCYALDGRLMRSDRMEGARAEWLPPLVSDKGMLIFARPQGAAR